MTKNKNLFPLLAFFLVLAGHAAWAISHPPVVATCHPDSVRNLTDKESRPIPAFKDAEAVQQPFLSLLHLYAARQDYFLSFSYALLAAFTTYALLKLVENRKRAFAAASGGLLLTGGVYAITCFAIGCCGSPMLAVYLGVLGSHLAGFEKPILAGITAVSVAAGWWWCRRCCLKDCSCCPPSNLCI